MKIALSFLLFSLAEVQGAALEQRVGPASACLLGVQAAPEGLTVGLSGQIRLVVTLEGPAPLEVDWPQPLAPASQTHWQLLPAGPPSRPAAGSWRQVFLLEPQQPGPCQLILTPLRFRTGRGPWQTVTWKPWSVRVTTQVPRAERALLRDITPPEEVPPPAGRLGNWLLAAGAALLVCLLGVWSWRRRRLPVALPAPPDQLARTALEHLAALPTADVPLGPHFTQLNDLLRRYLEQRFNLPARRQTTAELLHALRQLPDCKEEQHQLLGDLLARCDRARFASAPPQLADWHIALTEARRFLAETASAGATAPTTSPSGQSGEFPRVG
jgi:hypothetical protein